MGVMRAGRAMQEPFDMLAQVAHEEDVGRRAVEKFIAMKVSDSVKHGNTKFAHAQFVAVHDCPGRSATPWAGKWKVWRCVNCGTHFEAGTRRAARKWREVCGKRCVPLVRTCTASAPR